VRLATCISNAVLQESNNPGLYLYIAVLLSQLERGTRSQRVKPYLLANELS